MRFSDAIEGCGIELFWAARERGLEGIVTKRKSSLYFPGRRSNSWLKIKARMQQEALIGGLTEPGGGRHYFGALMLGVYERDRLQYVGHTGTGFSEATLKELYRKLGPHFTGKCPFTPKPKANAPVNGFSPSSFTRSRSRSGQAMAGCERRGTNSVLGKDPKIAYKTINARTETVESAPSYREAFKKRRCLIPADGFHEWRTIGGTKIRFAVGMRDDRPFTFAGPWKGWKDPDTASPWIFSSTLSRISRHYSIMSFTAL